MKPSQDKKTKPAKGVDPKMFFVFVGLGIISILFSQFAKYKQSSDLLYISEWFGRTTLGIFMFFGGLNHFNPKIFQFYKNMIPPFLLFPDFLVYFSGILESLSGLLIMIPGDKWREIGAWSVIWILILIFPANIYCAVDEIARRKVGLSASQAYFRLPIQLIFLQWAYELVHFSFQEFLNLILTL